MKEAVAGIYSVNRSMVANLQWRLGENRSDNTSFQFNPNDRGGSLNEAIDEFLMLSDNPFLGSYWSTNYVGIARANFLLERLGDAEFQNETTRNAITGETLFLRSWFYFNLVRSFGDVPFTTSAADSPDKAVTEEFLTRVSAAEIYQNIFSDTETAINLLPESWNAQNVGRATKGAALMLKAKMHMELGEFGEAIPPLEELERLGYELLPDYESVFNPANKNHAESIMEIQYSFGVGQSSNFISGYVPFNSGMDILGDSGPAGPRAGQNQPTRGLIDLYGDDDPRRDNNIGFYFTEVDTIPWLAKYAYPFLDRGQQDVNFPMFRYADALLMLAECYNETGTGNPKSIVEQIRSRAGIPDPTISATDQEDLGQAIADERRLELAFENKRWFDLVRTGKAVEVMTAHGMEQKAQKTTVLPDAYTNIRTILGIPNGQIIEFGYEQNPGW
jgi:tetratricopeptide (TPR) repeat protein